MKKRFLVAAMAAAMVSPLAANAEATVYGNVHVSIDDFDSAQELDMNSNTSSIGVKGKEDLGGGMSALFKLEWQVDVTERNNAKNDSTAALVDRDQWVGLKGAMGTVKFGTMSSNYKQMGGKVDPMYRTGLEGRGFMNTQSGLHGGASENGGRMTNAIQYSSPKMGGMQAVLNYTVHDDGADEDSTFGIGLRYQQKEFMAYIDYLDVQAANGGNQDVALITGSDSEAAIKIGGSFSTDMMTIGLQFESVEDVVGSDILFLSGDFKVSESGSVYLTVGDVDQLDDMGFAIMYNHDLSKRTNVYVGYGDNASDDVVGLVIPELADEQLTTVGIRHKF